MADQLPPRRLSNDRNSPYFDQAAINRGVEVYFNGYRQTANVIEYDVDAGTIKRVDMTALGVVRRDKWHQKLTVERSGKVVVTWKGEPWPIMAKR